MRRRFNQWERRRGRRETVSKSESCIESKPEACAVVSNPGVEISRLRSERQDEIVERRGKLQKEVKKKDIELHRF